MRWAHFLRLCRKKPGYPLQVLESADALSAGFPLLSLARAGKTRGFTHNIYLNPQSRFSGLSHGLTPRASRAAKTSE
jgi:hypothetical protein